MSVYTYAGDGSPSVGTAGIRLASGIVYLGQHADFLASEVTSLQNQGFVLLPGPSTSPSKQLSAPTVAAGSSGVLSGVYRWCVTFVTAAGETGPGPEVSFTITGTQATLTNIPVGSAKSGVTARRVYRTIAGGASHTEKLVGTISDNTTTSITDNVADGSLGAVLPTSDTSFNFVNTSVFEWAQQSGQGPTGQPQFVPNSAGVTAGWVLTADGSGGYVWAAPSGGGGGDVDGISVATKTSAYTLVTADQVILADATGVPFTLTLPTAVGFTGMYWVEAITASTNVVTLAAAGSQTISGASTVTLGTVASGAPYLAVTLVSDGANWRII